MGYRTYDKYTGVETYTTSYNTTFATVPDDRFGGYYKFDSLHQGGTYVDEDGNETYSPSIYNPYY